MAFVSFVCSQCGQSGLKRPGDINRSQKIGAPLFCGKKCFGASRRSGKTQEQKIAEKAEYDRDYRANNIAMLRAKKAAYHKRTYDPVAAAAHRQERMPQHVEYCRRPGYRAWKRDYDRKYRAEKDYGEFAECFLLVMDIRAECLSQMSDYEIRMAKGTLGKTQRRRRDYERSVRKELEVGPVGNLELGQGWQNGGLASGLRRLSGSGNSSHDQHSITRGSAVEAPGRRRGHHVCGKLNVQSNIPSSEPSA